MKNWTKIIEERQDVGIIWKRAERASIGTVGPDRSPAITKTTIKIKKYFLPFDDLEAPFFGEEESIISVKIKYDLFLICLSIQ